MANYILSCSSTADLSKEHFEARDIHYVCFHYELNGVSHPDDLGQSIPFDEFYRAMDAGASTKTSQINTEEYCDYFESFLKEGLDVLHVTLSSGISGTINSAVGAQAILTEKYPDRKIIVIDSLAASSGYGLLMDRIADMRDSGLNIDELAAWIEENKLKLQHWFFSTTLKYYIRGGRVSKAAGFIGEVLGICPLLHVDEAGKLIPMEKIRSKKAVYRAITQKMLALAENGADYDGKCYICQSACMPDARAVADLVEANFPHLNGKVEINNIGTTIGAHTGPGTVALFFWGKSRKEG
ncbi:MAG: DegV family protein [Clostridia bacterium]|nr:DegV family protein [Clostridia bacterium]